MSLMLRQARAPFRPNPSQGDPGLLDWGRRALSFGAQTALGMTGFSGASGAIRGAIGPSQVRPQGPPQQVVARPGLVGAAQRFFPGGGTGLIVAQDVNGNGLACATGHRPNKTSYFLKDGTFVEKGTRCVKRRQRNPMNPRALSRAIGRIDAGKRFQNRMSQISTGRFTAAGKKKSCG